MITCALQGGLGNQMFQIASTMGHATKFGLDYGFDLNYAIPHKVIPRLSIKKTL